MKGGRAVDYVKRLVKEVLADDLMGQAAQCAYALAFSLFPFILLLISIASFLPSKGPGGPIPPELLHRMPSDVQHIISARIQEIADQKNGGALTFAALLTIYSAASGMAVLVTAVNRAYDVPEQRPFWRRILVGVMLVFAGIVLVMLPALWGAAGGALASLATRFGLSLVATAIAWLRWPVMIVGAFAWLALLFRVAPEKYGKWRIVTPGAVFSAVGLLVANFGLSFYVSKFSNMSASYGAVGGFIVMLLWLYASSLVLLVGAEVNSLVEESRHVEPRPSIRERTARSPGLRPVEQS